MLFDDQQTKIAIREDSHHENLMMWESDRESIESQTESQRVNPEKKLKGGKEVSKQVEGCLNLRVR